MALRAEWRTNGEFDAILIVDDRDDKVQEALMADAGRLSRLLTTMGGLDGWHGEHAVDATRRDPQTWGALVLARAATGEVINMDPERYWNGIYAWFRSRGVDYDTVRPVSG